MTKIKQAKKSVKWFALFNGLSQAFSFTITIIIARILTPSDYGLIEMAGILVGYVVLFCDLGVGLAIVQRKQNSQEELSSLFWFTLVWGCVLCLFGIILAYPTAWIFNNHDVILLTQVSSGIFLAGGVGIVPKNILERNVRFGVLGFAEGGALIFSCCIMLVMAKFGFGVWLLVVGQVVREYMKVILYCYYCNWQPSFIFSFDKIRPYLKFGLNVALGNSLYYVYSKSDRFFGGKFFSTHMLGEYSFALELASIPIDKIVSFVNRFSYPILANSQESLGEFTRIYLKIVKFISFVTFPMYIGAYLLANDLIVFFLGEKWISIVRIFQLFCIAQLFISVTTINKVVFNAVGRPAVNLYFQLSSFILVPLLFYFCSKNGFEYMIIPWLTIIPMIALVHGIVLVVLFKIRPSSLLMCFFHGIFGSALMSVAILFMDKYILIDNMLIGGFLAILLKVSVGIVVYLLYSLCFNREMFFLLKSFK